MKPELKDIDELIARHLPSASPQQVENAGMRVLHRLRMQPNRAADSDLGRLDRVELIPIVTWRRTAMTWGAAAALIAVAVGVSIQWQSGTRPAPIEVVERLSLGTDNHLGALSSGENIEVGQPVRTSGDAGAMLTLVDGSTVEMRSQSELSLERAADGLQIRLGKGSIIVNAAKQRNGHLYVATRDVTVSVVGTVFLVNADEAGSHVGVIEGEVQVREGQRQTSLRPGQQVSTSPKLVVRPLKEEVAWSRNAVAIQAILDSFTRGMARTAGPLEPMAKTPLAAQDAGAPRPEFEEASVRLCDPNDVPSPPAGARGGGVNSMQMTPGRAHALCLTLATLIRTAYGYAPADFFTNGGRGPGFNFNNVYGLGVEDGRRVRGGPDWVRSERYTIDAVAVDAADAATMSGPMLRALLEKRFHLQAHIESDQIPAFALSVAPGGLKLREGICTPPESGFVPPRSTTDVARKNYEAARRGTTTAAPCGMVIAAHGPNMIQVGAGASIPPLTGVLGTPVVDRTGIPSTARFNYVLEFSPDDTTRGPFARAWPPAPGLQIAEDPGQVPRAPNIFTALEEQLGLRLEPTRAPQEFIVIDRVERPTAN